MHLSKRRIFFFAILLSTAGLFAWGRYFSSSERTYKLEARTGAPILVTVPNGFQSAGIRGANGKISQIRLSAEAKVWAEAARRANCIGDLENFVRRSESIRSDFSLLLWSKGYDDLRGMFEIFKRSRGEETSIVNWDGTDQKHPRKFVIDISNMIQSRQMTFADCYYSKNPAFFCNIEGRISPNVMGKFGIPKGLSKFWREYLSVMTCASAGMITVSDTGQ